MKRSTRRLASNDSAIKIVIWLIVVAIIVAASYYVIRRIEINSMAQDEIRGNLSNDFIQEKSIELRGKNYKLRTGVKLLSFIGLSQYDQEKPINTYSANSNQVKLIVLLVIDSKNKILYPIQINSNIMIDDIDSGLGDRIRVANLFNVGKSAEQGCEYILKAMSNLFYGIEISDYILLDLSILPNALNYKESVKDIIYNGKLKDVLNSQNSTYLTNVKSGQLLDLFLSVQNYKKNDIIVLAGEDRIADDGLIEYNVDQQNLEELATNLIFESEGDKW
jgi:hypothetical protein